MTNDKYTKKRDKPATAGQSRLPILKERRTLINNITLIENSCQLLMKKIFNNLGGVDFSCQPYAGKSMMRFQFL